MELEIILLYNTLTKKDLEDCVHYIFASLFLSLKDSTRETGEEVFISLQKFFSFS